MSIRLLSIVLLLTFTSRVEAQLKVRLYYGVDTESAIVKVKDHSNKLLLNGKEKIQAPIPVQNSYDFLEVISILIIEYESPHFISL